MTIILASASPRRRDLLRQVGLEPVIIPADIDEAITETDPAEKVKKLSYLKAEAVAERLSREAAQGPEGSVARIAYGNNAIRPAQGKYIILAADTVVAIDGAILGKPKTHEEAHSMISSLQGRIHSVFTGVTLLLPACSSADDPAAPDFFNARNSADPAPTAAKAGSCAAGTADTFAVETRVHVRSMTEGEIRAYADSAEPMDKAGSYGIQGAFAAYIEGIEGDYTNVVGLPLCEVMQRLSPLL